MACERLDTPGSSAVVDKTAFILKKIERCLMFFQQSSLYGPRPTLYVPGNEESCPLELGNQSAYRIVCALAVLQDVYALLINNTHRTKRSIFYAHKQLFGVCCSLDLTLRHVCQLLQEPRVNLHIISCSKGLLMGDLHFILKDGREINFNAAPVSIPPCIDDIDHIKSSANFILIVEKDTVFQTLCQEHFCHVYNPCILITAMGYPDYATRVLLSRLNEILHLPMFALMDCDAHGIEIFLTYKYGSVNKDKDINVEHVDLKSLRWIGIYPSEIQALNLNEDQYLVLTNREKDRIKSMLKRRVVKKDQFLLQQLKKMLSLGFKVELEALCTLGHFYLSQVYFCLKLPKLLQDMFVQQ